MSDLSLEQLERRVLESVSGEEMWRHMEYLCQIDRTSGTEGEHQAVDYVVETLKKYGLPVEVYEFDAYLSYPVSATLETVSETPESFPAKTRSFSGSTPEGGVIGEVVYVPGGKDMFRDFETKKRLEALDLRGKIVLSEGGGRQNMLFAQEKGAVGYLHLWPSDEEQLHEGIVTPVWGTPTPETVGRIPQIPVATVNQATGRRLLSLAQQGPVRVRLTTKVETGWRRVRLPVTTIPGQTDEFVLIAGHIDSWHLGATDNATGNAACLEIARVLAQYKDRLRRGVRIAWWPGHSTGRYAGSAWYADNFWQELYDHCITYINVDSPGSLGAVEYRTVTAMAENARFAIDTVRDVTGQTPNWERPLRAGDQSFWGAGVPSLYMLLSERPKDQSARVGGSGGGWWWHTEEDTLDKADRDILVKDTRVYTLAAFRLCTADMLPLDVGALTKEVEGIVAELKQQAQGRLDLQPVEAETERLAAACRQVQAALARLDDAGRQQAAGAYNRGALRAVKAIIPVNYTESGQFDHDPAVPLPPFPGLQPAARLASLDPGSDEFRFLHTKLVRERNRVVFALRQAAVAMEEAAAEIANLKG